MERFLLIYRTMSMKGNRNRIVLSGLPEGHFSEQFTLENAVFARENPFDIYGGEVEAFVEGDRTGNVFQLNIALRGFVKTICDRCADDLDLPINASYPFVVKFGQTTDLDDVEELIVSMDDPVLPMDDLLYQLVVLSIPMKRVHADGECNADSMRYYAQQEEDERKRGLLPDENEDN